MPSLSFFLSILCYPLLDMLDNLGEGRARIKIASDALGRIYAVKF